MGSVKQASSCQIWKTILTPKKWGLDKKYIKNTCFGRFSFNSCFNRIFVRKYIFISRVKRYKQRSCHGWELENEKCNLCQLFACLRPKIKFWLGLTQPINYHLKKYRYPAWSLSYLLIASLVSSSITHLARGQALLFANQVAGCFLQSVIQRKDLEEIDLRPRGIDH